MTTTSKSAPDKSSRPQARPSGSSRAPSSSPRPPERPSGAPSGMRPEARPTDGVNLSPETRETEEPATSDLVGGLNDSFTNAEGATLAEAAEAWAGRDFKPGESARCADFVSHVVEESGINAPDFEHTVRARDFGEMGEPVEPDQLQPGDVVAFNNTYRHSANPEDHTHVGIYVGEGMMVHRPTAAEPVERVSLEEYLARPTPDGIPPRSLEGGYRLQDTPVMMAGL